MSDRSMDELVSNAPDMPWLEHAACGDLSIAELDLFFVDAGRTISAETEARCRRCPVRTECLEHAVEHQIVSGYFGGMSPGKRRSLAH